MDHTGLDEVRLVGHQDDGLLLQVQLGDAQQGVLGHSQGGLVVHRANYHKSLRVVHGDQPLQLKEKSFCISWTKICQIVFDKV